MTEPGEGVDAPAAGPVAVDEGWERFHPLSPLLRGGLVLIGIVGYVISTFVDDLLGAWSGPPEVPADDPSYEVSIFAHPLIAAGVALLAILGACALGAASWWFTRYRLGPSTIEVRSGVVFRQHRQIRYAQIQAVNTAQPLLARLVGLAEVRVESAGGDSSHVSLAYLGRTEAEALRGRIVDLAGSAGADPVGEGGEVASTSPVAPGASQGTTLMTMPLQRLVGSIVLSAGAIFVAIFSVAAVVLAWTVGSFAVASLIPALFFAGLSSVRQLLTWANLVVRHQGDTLRSQHGLTSLATSTVPIRRVQALEVVQTYLWRRPGWWRLAVNIAGVKVGGEGVVDAGVLVPAATRREIGALVDLLSPTRDTSAALAVLDGGLPDDAVRCPPAARWFGPWEWRRRGVLLADEMAVIRSGVLSRVVTIVPWGRIQSVTVEQGPWDRRLGLASVRLVSTAGRVDPRAKHLAVGDAHRVAEEMRRRATVARRTSQTSPGGQAAMPGPDVVGLT